MNINATQPRKPLIAAILPSYNEARNIGIVMEVLRHTRGIDEIIFVDDGSTDGTVEQIQEFLHSEPRARLIRHDKNQGKGAAMFTGWESTQAPFLIMLDTDLKDLHPEHVQELIEPVLQHHAEMTLGLFVGGRLHTDLALWVTPFLTGQRGLRADLMKHVSRNAAEGYGFEVALTVAANRQGFRTRVVPMKGVWHPSSEFHRGLWLGLKWRLRMYGQILRAWYVATGEQHPMVRDFISSIIKP